MTQEVKALPTQPDGLSLIPGTPMVDLSKNPTACHMTSTCMPPTTQISKQNLNIC